ncbi:MAG: hypothetical protein DSZ07_03000 [Sulfurovum sp.]|nr:MAG: hypothetical protein DSZ07_03000 [Sulfurovum sp.]
MKKLLLLITLITLFISCASDSKNINNSISTQKSIKNIPIPFREHGYSQHASQLIVSKKAFDSFIMQIGNGDNWNKKTEVLEALQNANIDFKKNNLLFYRITRGSGSIKLDVDNSNIILNNNEITINIKESTPSVGTADMAYYALAYKVNKTIKTITFDNKKQKVIIENKESDMVVPKNCKAWSDGCNNCHKIGDDDKGACTKRACLVYRPQDFRCTAWEE